MDEQQMRAFLVTAEQRSLSGAARQLNVSLSTVSRRVDALERRVDAVLFVRTGRGVRLTPSGERLLPRARRALREIELACIEARREDAEGVDLLRISVPNEIALSVMPRVLAELHEAHPAVRFEIHAQSRRVGLVEEGFDATIRIGEPESPSLLVRPLEPIELSLYAWPAMPRIEDAEHLNSRRFIYVDRTRSAPIQAFWGGAPFALHFEHAVTVSTFTEAASLASLCPLIALLPAYTAHRFVERGALRIVAPRFSIAPVPLNVLLPVPRRSDTLIQEFAARTAAALAQANRALSQLSS